jgi:hypothetical protein
LRPAGMDILFSRTEQTHEIQCLQHALKIGNVDHYDRRFSVPHNAHGSASANHLGKNTVRIVAQFINRFEVFRQAHFHGSFPPAVVFFDRIRFSS